MPCTSRIHHFTVGTASLAISTLRTADWSCFYRRRRVVHRMAATATASTSTYACVYCGEGAGHRSILSAVEGLEKSLSIQVRQLGTEELLTGTWQNNCAVLCMPGGADLPYCRDLNGKGNKLITEYVQGGGSYLGLCAGGYYACASIEFELGTPLEVKGKRELGFFPGLGKGAVYPGFTYATEAGTRAAPISFKGSKSRTAQCRDYSNGGPAFLCPDNHADFFEQLAWYEGERGAAAVRCKVGRGLAVLCGTHPELHPRWLDAACDAKALKEAHPEYSDIKITQLVDRAKEVRLCLQEDAVLRQDYWESLLSEAGLQNYLRMQQNHAPED